MTKTEVIREWSAGQVVEACDPREPFPRPWYTATVVRQLDGSSYVTVRRESDGCEWSTYCLNVRLPGTPDPVGLL